MKKLKTYEQFISEKVEKAKGDRGSIDDSKIETALKSKAKESGVPLALLRIVMRRGMDAWNSGHRPGVTQQAWGYARVNAFLEKGKGTWGGADSDVAKEVRDKGIEPKAIKEGSAEVLLPKRNKWLQINPNKHKELAGEFFDLIQIAYSTLGGHAKVKSPKDVFSDPDWTWWQGVDLHDSPDLDLIVWGQHTKYGIKFSGVGHDGKKPSTREYLDHKGDNLRKKGFYGELSGRLADIMLLKYGVNVIEDEKEVEKLLGGKDITWHGQHPTNPNSPGNGWYSRKLGGKMHTKIMVGKPKGI